MWIVKIALHRPYTFIVLALLTGAHLPIVNRNACEGKCDCVEVCPHEFSRCGASRMKIPFRGKLKSHVRGQLSAYISQANLCQACGLCVAACPERAISSIPNTNSREIPK